MDYDYFLSHYKLIATDLSQQSADLTRQQINFFEKLNQNAKYSLLLKRQKKTELTFKQNSADIS